MGGGGGVGGGGGGDVGGRQSDSPTKLDNRLESQVSKYSNDYFERPIVTMLSVPIFQS